jgi:rhomboid protease GlpG
MRQVGTLSTERQARQFAAWLVSQRIEAHAEEESGTWVVWVREEDQLPLAREALVHFREHPDDAKYHGAEQSAEMARREEAVRRRQAQGNVVEMRGRWSSGPGMPGAARRCPIVLVLIGLSALVALLTSGDTMDEERSGKPPGLIYGSLTFVDPSAAVSPDGQLDVWANIRSGEVWRLVTPIFLHFDIMHIVFNMIVLYSFGAAVEDRRGSLFMLALVLGLAVLSNVGQAIETSWRDQVPLFGGMSGVGYGLFGYVAIKAKFDSRERYFLSPMTTFMALLWFALCILRDIPPFTGLLAGAIPPIANTAHAVGLLAGAAIAYAPLLARKPA